MDLKATLERLAFGMEDETVDIIDVHELMDAIATWIESDRPVTCNQRKLIAALKVKIEQTFG